MLQPDPRPRRNRTPAEAALFWTLVLAVPLLLAVLLLATFRTALVGASAIGLAAAALMVAGLTVVWVGGVRSLGLWLLAALRRHESPPQASMGRQRVALVCCTADDFDGPSLARSMAQTVAVDTVILDDSKTARARDEVDRFARLVGAEVVRRGDRRGFKAGNLNHGLSVIAGRYDFVVLLDSDTELPPSFVASALRTAATSARIGVVQGLVRARTGSTAFSATLARLLGVHLETTHLSRGAVGVGHLLGRGALVRTECVRRAGGFPELVMEDLAFSIAVRRAGYRVVSDPTLVSSEEYPSDYPAFRVQYGKTIEGATELLLAARTALRGSGLRWWERLDLVFELAHPVVAPVGAAAVVSGGLVLAATGADPALPVWAAALTSLFVAAPLLPATVRTAREDGAVDAVRFLTVATLLYASTLVLTVRSSLSVLIRGKGEFRVTPKGSAARAKPARLTLEAVIAGGACVAGLVFAGTLLPVLPLVAPLAGGALLLLWGSRPVDTAAERTVAEAERVPV